MAPETKTRPPLSRYFRLGILPLALALVASAGLAFLLHRVLDAAVAERAEQDLVRALERAAPEFEGLLERSEPVEERVRALARQFDARVTLADAAGNVLADSAVEPIRIASLENHAGRPEIRRAMAGGTGFDRRTSATVATSFVYVARRLGSAASPSGCLRFAVSETALLASEAPFRATATTLSLAAGALVFAVLVAVRLRYAAEQARLARSLARAAGGERPTTPERTSEGAADVYAALARFAELVQGEREESRRAAALARAVFEEVPAALVVVNRQLNVLEANPAFARLTGLVDPITAAGKHLLEVVRSRELLAAFRAGLTGERVEGIVIHLDSGAGVETLVEVSVRLLAEDGRADAPAAVGVVFDVTAREKVESLRRRFVADVSHELRTPLASIRAAAETLDGEELPTPEQRHLVAVVQRQAGHMQALVSDLMDLSLIESGASGFEPGPVAVGELLAEAAADLKEPAALRRVALKIAALPTIRARGDRRRLSQVFRNLFDNAIKFSPEGSDVEVEAFIVTGDGGPGRVAVRIADHGIGIPRAAHDGIFQRFYRVDPSRNKAVPGTGLGLAIVKHLVLLHGGTVTVESEPGRGSTFTVILPSA